jgi:hypothetical protein
MKAYFVGSLTGRKKYIDNYRKIIEVLGSLNIEVLEDTIRPTHDEVSALSDDEKVEFYKQVLKWIGQADFIVADVSYPSVGVGYEISLAQGKSKPVLVLHDKEAKPQFIEGIDDEKVVVVEYSFETLEERLKGAIDYLSDQQDTRFNFFISPKQQNYLDWVTKHKKIPRAVFLRRLIEDDMKNNPDFS